MFSPSRRCNKRKGDDLEPSDTGKKVCITAPSVIEEVEDQKPGPNYGSKCTTETMVKGLGSSNKENVPPLGLNVVGPTDSPLSRVPGGNDTKTSENDDDANNVKEVNLEASIVKDGDHTIEGTTDGFVQSQDASDSPIHWIETTIPLPDSDDDSDDDSDEEYISSLPIIFKSIYSFRRQYRVYSPTNSEGGGDSDDNEVSGFSIRMPPDPEPNTSEEEGAEEMWRPPPAVFRSWDGEGGDTPDTNINESTEKDLED